MVGVGEVPGLPGFREFVGVVRGGGGVGGKVEGGGWRGEVRGMLRRGTFA